MSGKDDFVEDLFRDLPKSKAMSELELKRHEKMILAKIEEMKLVQDKKQSSLYVRFQTQFQLAAGFLVLVGGLAFVLNQSNTTSSSDLNVAIEILEKSIYRPISIHVLCDKDPVSKLDTADISIIG